MDRWWLREERAECQSARAARHCRGPASEHGTTAARARQTNTVTRKHTVCIPPYHPSCGQYNPAERWFLGSWNWRASGAARHSTCLCSLLYRSTRPVALFAGHITAPGVLYHLRADHTRSAPDPERQWQYLCVRSQASTLPFSVPCSRTSTWARRASSASGRRVGRVLSMHHARRHSVFGTRCSALGTRRHSFSSSSAGSRTAEGLWRAWKRGRARGFRRLWRAWNGGTAHAILYALACSAYIHRQGSRSELDQRQGRQ